MIKRTAECLFWIGRYLERTENNMRLINVNFHSRHVLTENDTWERMINMIGDLKPFQERYSEVDESTAIQYLTFETMNPNSLISCVYYIRNNVRALRQILPSELWDSINSFYLWFQEQDISKMMSLTPYLFFQRMREWLSAINGTADSTMVRDLAWDFIQAGKFYERAENQIRNLQTCLNGKKESGQSDNHANYFHFIRLLKCAGGYEAFRKQYADRVTLEKVIEFLIIDSSFPHSVNYALSSLEIYLHKIKRQDDQFESHAGEALAVAAIIKEALTGICDYSTAVNLLASLLEAVDKLGREILDTFFQEELVEA